MHIEIQYLPCLEYVSLLIHSNHVEFEVMENFPKQTFRNRTYLLGANGMECLTVPTIRLTGQKVLTKDIRIDYFQDWQRRHMGAIRAGYGKAPFFEYFEPYISDIFAKKNKFLVHVATEAICLCFILVYVVKCNRSLKSRVKYLEDKNFVVIHKSLDIFMINKKSIFIK